MTLRLNWRLHKQNLKTKTELLWYVKLYLLDPLFLPKLYLLDPLFLPKLYLLDPLFLPKLYLLDPLFLPNEPRSSPSSQELQTSVRFKDKKIHELELEVLVSSQKLAAEASQHAQQMQEQAEQMDRCKVCWMVNCRGHSPWAICCVCPFLQFTPQL